MCTGNYKTSTILTSANTNIDFSHKKNCAVKKWQFLEPRKKEKKKFELKKKLAQELKKKVADNAAFQVS